MSTFTDFSPCPQCGFEQAHDEIETRTSSRTLSCTECGYREEQIFVNVRFVGAKAEYDDLKIDKNEGVGALCYSAGAIGFSTAYSKLPDGRADIDFDELKREMAALFAQRKVSSYRITRWRPTLKKVEVVAEEHIESNESRTSSADETSA